MGTVTVTGSRSGTVRPDRARISLTVTEIDRDPAVAMERTVRRSTALEALLRDIGIPPEQWTTSGVSVREEYEWRNDRNELVGHRATASLQVTVRELAQLGPVLSRSVTEVAAQVAGPWWQVDDDNPAMLALLTAAAHDARRRAEAYAAALDLRLGEVEAISEEPFGGGGPGPVRPEAMAMRAMAKSDVAEEMPVNPGEVELNATIHVRFALIPGR